MILRFVTMKYGSTTKVKGVFFMEVQVAFRHMETSPALREYAQPKLQERVNKIDARAIQMNLNFLVDGMDYVANVTVIGGDGTRYHAEGRSDIDMFIAVDSLIDKVETQMVRHKEKLISNRFRQNNLRKVIPIELRHRDGAELDDSIDATEVLRFEIQRRRMLAEAY